MSTARSPMRSIVRATTTMRRPHSRSEGSAMTSTRRSTKRRFARSMSSSSSTRLSAPARSRCENDSSATRNISSARSPISTRTPTRAGSGSASATSFESFATVTQPSKLVADADPDPALVGVLVEMGDRAEEMLRVALDSFAQRDLEGAESLVELDELIDRANRRFVERLVDVMAEPDLREWGLRMVVVARTIERIGDRAVDIGEQTAYLLTAEFREFTDASHPAAP